MDRSRRLPRRAASLKRKVTVSNSADLDDAALYAGTSDSLDLDSCSVFNDAAGSIESAYAGVSSSQHPALGIKPAAVAVDSKTVRSEVLKDPQHPALGLKAAALAVESTAVRSEVLEDPQHPFFSPFGGIRGVRSGFASLREVQQSPAAVGGSMGDAPF